MAAGDTDPADAEHDGDALRLAHQVALVVQRLRNTAGFTQEELADRAGLHRTHIGLVERGERHLSVAAAVKLANALGLSLADLIAEAERELDQDIVDHVAAVAGEPIEI